MKLKVISIILVLGISTVGALSFLSVVSIDHTAQHLCPISALMGSDCPQIQSSLAFVSHHLAGLQNTMKFILISSIFLIVSFLVVRTLSTTVLDDRSFFLKLNVVQSYIPSSIREMFSWFALRNRGENYALSWVHVRT